MEIGFTLDMSAFDHANDARLNLLASDLWQEVGEINRDAEDLLRRLTPKKTHFTSENWVLGEKRIPDGIEYSLTQDAEFHKHNKSKRFPSGIPMWLLVIWLEFGTRRTDRHHATPEFRMLTKTASALRESFRLLARQFEGTLRLIDTGFAAGGLS